MEHNRIKQRIVGGLILVSIAVIILPMILSESGQSISESGAIPAKPAHLVHTEIIPLEIKKLPDPDDTVQRTVLPRSVAVSEADEASETAVIEETPSDKAPSPLAPAVPVTPKPVAHEAKADHTERSPAQPAAVSGWVVQVGSFSSEKNAFGLRDKLRSHGFTAFVEKVEGSSKASYRVRIGPEIDRQQAEQKLAKLKSQMKMDGLVMRHR